MIRRPPRSTLFPTRRSSDLFPGLTKDVEGRVYQIGVSPFDAGAAYIARSEEHTSELQSLAYLVCRLLLEKKKSRRHVDLPGRYDGRGRPASDTRVCLELTRM